MVSWIDILTRIAQDIKAARWDKGIAAGDLNTFTSPGEYAVQSVSVANTPVSQVGNLRVVVSSGIVSQFYTTSNESFPRQYRRRRTGTTWGAWQLISWRGGLLLPGTDWNTLTDPTTYGIQSASHPNQPAPAIGTLEVVPASASALQRFTTWELVPREFIRRAYNGGWQAWTQTPTAADLSSLSARIDGIEPGGTVLSAPTRADLSAAPVTVVSKPNGEIVTSLSRDRSRGWNWGGNTLRETRDDGQTWAIVPTMGTPFAGTNIESVRQLANGQLLVTANFISETRRAALVSTNYGGNGPVEFVRTLTASAPYVKFAPSWSMYDHGRIALLAEYGPKTGALWGGQTVNPGENARYVYLSMDYGTTWATVFDLNTFLTTAHGHTSTDTQHVHGVAWDAYWDRIWVSWGDNMGGNGSNGIAYSDDLGTTWNTAHYWSGPNAPHQAVGIQPMPKCILFFGDLGPDVIRIDRAEGRHSGAYTTEVAWDSTAPGTHLCQGYYRADRAGDDAPLLATFCAEGTASPSFAVATLDGWNFIEIWRDLANQAAGMGARSIVGPTLRGQIIINSDDQKVTGMRSQITAPAPGY